MTRLEKYADTLEGDVIKEIFNDAEAVAFLHQTIYCSRGGYFRRMLLQMLETKVSISEIKKLTAESELHESQRHIHKLLELQLIREENETQHYQRTNKGEAAINALRSLETNITREEAKKIFSSYLGLNSIRLFLRAYGTRKEINPKTHEIKFSASEIGKLYLFLPRSIEGAAAVDKLNSSGLLAYRDDGAIYLDSIRASGFYKYLKALYAIVSEEKGKNIASNN